MKFCPECGTQRADENVKFCSNCGYSFVGAAAQTPSPPSEVPKTPEPPVEYDTVQTDVDTGFSLEQEERIMRITPCKKKAFAAVKDGTLYITSRRVAFMAVPPLQKLGSFLGKQSPPTKDMEFYHKGLVKAEASGAEVKLSYASQDGKSASDVYVIGTKASEVAQQLMNVHLQSMTGQIAVPQTPIIDSYDHAGPVKSVLGIGAELLFKKLQKLTEEADKAFAEAAKEGDKGIEDGAKGREAEQKVAEIFEAKKYRILGRNLRLLNREIDLVVARGDKVYLVECKFKSSPLGVKEVDSYLDLYRRLRDSQQRIEGERINRLLFVAPIGGISRDAQSRLSGERMNYEIWDHSRWKEEAQKIDN
ncbi:MAG: zinc-ribbon domain-containing protein [Thaumarchaeota archaeon]|nr:zinc-ribbon domain-containing protein [Nitrososphaerota archaeon]